MRLLIAFGLFIFTCAMTDNTILLQRACRKQPTLEFCKGVFVPDVTEVTVQRGHAVKKVELILPPPIPFKENHTETKVEAEKPDDEVDFGNDSAEKVETNKTERVGSLLPLPKPVVNNPVTEKSGGEQEQAQSKVGSLLTLPKPIITVAEVVNKDTVVAVAPMIEPQVELELPKAATATPVKTKSEEELPSPPVVNSSATTPAATEPLESDKHVLVFVSEFCVVERERFVKKCHGEVDPKDVEFCKSYPPACTGTSNVIPVLTYCQRYFKEYPKLCAGSAIHELALQFCFAFEQFCLPELAAAAATQKETGSHPKSNLRRCEDVLPEARKVCNPFPHPRDTFNVLRCTQFQTHCKKFVDWL